MKAILKRMEAICEKLKKDYEAMIRTADKINKTSKTLMDDIDIFRTNIKEL